LKIYENGKIYAKMFYEKRYHCCEILENHKIWANIRETEKSQAIFAKICSKTELRKKSLKMTLFAETKISRNSANVNEISYYRENAIKFFRFNQDRRPIDSSDSKEGCSMVLKEWTSVSHLAQYVEHNNKIATDFYMVSCIIEFYIKQQGLRKPPPCIFQVYALQRRCML
jgi:hypothetical protein